MVHSPGQPFEPTLNQQARTLAREGTQRSPQWARQSSLRSGAPLVIVIGDAARQLGPLAELLSLGATVIPLASYDAAARWFNASVGSAEPEGLVMGNLEVDLMRLEIRCGTKMISTTPVEFQILKSLAARPHRAWSFQELTVTAWQSAYFGDSSALRSAIKRLRKKMRQAGATVAITSVRGTGFRLDVPPL